VLRDHIGFALFMFLLLIAPKVPLGAIFGIAKKSSMSLGIIGLVLWYITSFKKPFYFPRIKISHPLCWLIIFAVYAFIISLFFINIISVIYSVQYLLYVLIGTILMKRYSPNFTNENCRCAYSILFAVAVVYSLGIIVSIFSGPIYPHQVLFTHGEWGGLLVQKGVGFAENQNMAGPVVMFFTAACIYLYHGKIWKKWIFLTLLLFALLGTLSRGSIFSFILAAIFVYCMDNAEPFSQRVAIKVTVFRDVVFFMLVMSFLIILIALGMYFFNKSYLIAILTGLGLDSQQGVVTRDVGARIYRWNGGINNWTSQSITKMIFGGGFRSSMVLEHNFRAWKDADNMYITFLGDFGIVGLVLFLVALFVAFFHYIRLFLVGKAQNFEKFGLLVLLSLSIDNMTGSFFYSPICLSLLIFTFVLTL
jgi:hypothetical protein